MRAIAVTVVFLISLVGLCAYVVRVVPAQIETSIQADIEQQFALNELTTIAVTVNGRDVSLSGEVDQQDKVNQAMKLASSRAGVRVVMTSVSVSAQQSVEGKQEQSPSSNQP